MSMPLGRALAWSLLVLAGALVLSVAVGPVNIPLGVMWTVIAAKVGSSLLTIEGGATFATILLDIRLPHAILLLLTGAALAGSGAGYQALFRNPLADPYLIGVASGAGLGAVLAMSIRW
ncbi:MAG TPA: iron chelate uptake ABC transporter family permease subunit, partial [Anaerolineales bacterium]|nr:iron chelate uptake ABC transporter family permease subunit [Anaerolineales bacterium]